MIEREHMPNVQVGLHSGPGSREGILKSAKWRPFFAMICAMGWALAFPLIKVGYRELHIAATDTGSKILFAGVRFTFAGLLILLFCLLTKKDLHIKGRSNFCWLLLFALVNTTLHYLFSYVGLGYIPSSRGTILDSMGNFFLIIFSCALFADDFFTWGKLWGCLLGLAGIFLINFEPGGNLFSNITFMGDGMLLLNALFSASGGIITRVISQKTNIMTATGYSMAIGGMALCFISLAAGPAAAWNLSPAGILVILALVMISAVCFYIYNQLLSYHPISKVAIFCSFVSVLGVFYSALLLGEPLKWQYVAAAVTVSGGVYIVNRN